MVDLTYFKKLLLEDKNSFNATFPFSKVKVTELIEEIENLRFKIVASKNECNRLQKHINELYLIIDSEIQKNK